LAIVFSSCDGGLGGRVHPWDGAESGFSTSPAEILAARDDSQPTSMHDTRSVRAWCIEIGEDGGAGGASFCAGRGP
jgi:hypothetical protein